jgi:hypothetical protein
MKASSLLCLLDIVFETSPVITHQSKPIPRLQKMSGVKFFSDGHHGFLFMNKLNSLNKMLPMIITPKKKEEVVRLIPKTASVSIILPFEPKMAAYSTLKESIHNAVAEAETALLKDYTVAEVSPLLSRLHGLTKKINYNTHKKSIAILVAADFEKIFYLDIPVKKFISVTDTFQLKDLIRIKKVKEEYLVFVLDQKNAKLFLGNEFGLLKLILHDTHEINLLREIL